ncbi:unnamed protein product [Aspergillus oryzae RIB40]|uniref:DNA, SC012 n=2 Tax=Aspergillus oryzae TaxID=5062 RepID=Q2UBY9_ASPOR|nr:unnamed protein product [Aspergillus oryzae RIB40]EIT79401.1 hypothetical protein Ao3042_04188 [Aspergillus oryzae 3.042]KDE77153.1 hypothetical protein AO1008_02977 [Aspergillus oryzae 100-8]BAE60926.1 unnamed protein product [Aspergillus oryzae RIB40]|eukprot:EIT79401.1 hypothetical protein Ao3042_04188 [Aspergillus oryzae 3.042]
MRVASTIQYIFHLPYLTKRTERSIWKGKGIDDSPSIEVTVHCHDDDSQSTGSEMAVNASELDLHHGGSSNSSGSRSRLVRVVSWASIVCDKCRWTPEQERELAIAQSELGRCQKAWSSEQELWLSHAWNRRRSSEEQPVDANAHRASSKVRRFRKRHTGDFY